MLYKTAYVRSPLPNLAYPMVERRMTMELKDIIALSVGAIILLAAIVYMVIHQRTKIIEWLKYAVSMAENELGKYTGQLKLRLVYDWFVEKFPIVASILPFKVFSSWVDVALNTMNKWINTKSPVGTYIETGEKISALPKSSE